MVIRSCIAVLFVFHNPRSTFTTALRKARDWKPRNNGFISRAPRLKDQAHGPSLRAHSPLVTLDRLLRHHTNMLRSCSHSVRRCVSVVLQNRTISCVRTIARPAAAAEGVWLGFLPASHQLSILVCRRTRGLSTLSDEELRRKMDDFNDLFVTVRTAFLLAE